MALFSISSTTRSSTFFALVTVLAIAWATPLTYAAVSEPVLVCCHELVNATDSIVTDLLKLFGIPARDLDLSSSVGIGCTRPSVSTLNILVHNKH